MKTTSSRAPGGALLPLVAAILTLSGVLSAAPRFVMEIRDHEGTISIPGDSDAAGHPGAIEVVSFGKGYTPANGFPTVATTGLECGIVTDKAMPKLLEALCLGSTLPQVDLFYLGDDSLAISPDAAHMRLEHVQLTELTAGIGAVNPLGPAFATSGVHVAHLSFNFSKVTWTYQKLDPAGTVTDESSATHVAFVNTEDPNFDDDGDGLSNADDEDDDNDQIPDHHENGSGTNALVDDAHEDPDRDRHSNLNEWITGTDAHDGTSFFAIGSISVTNTPAGQTATISFPVIGNRHYRLLGTFDATMPKESWIELDSFLMPAGSLESDAEVVLNPAILPQLGRMLFQVEVRHPSSMTP